MGSALLVAIDEQTERAAVHHVGELAKELGAPVVLAHVAGNPPFAGSATQLERDRKAALRRARENLHWVPRELPDGLQVRARVELGSPVETLLHIAHEEKAGLLAIGSRGRGAFVSALLGSASMELVRRSRSFSPTGPPAPVRRSPASAASSWSPSPAGPANRTLNYLSTCTGCGEPVLAPTSRRQYCEACGTPQARVARHRAAGSGSPSQGSRPRTENPRARVRVSQNSENLPGRSQHDRHETPRPPRSPCTPPVSDYKAFWS